MGGPTPFGIRRAKPMPGFPVPPSSPIEDGFLWVYGDTTDSVMSNMVESRPQWSVDITLNGATMNWDAYQSVVCDLASGKNLNYRNHPWPSFFWSEGFRW